MNTGLKEAFEELCQPIPAGRWYLILIEEAPFYGGPEEGGWWGSDSFVVCYKEFVSEELVNKAKQKVEDYVKELQREAQREYGVQCLRETEWLEARGLDDNYLPEPDGPSDYRLVISENIPENSYGERQYS